MHWVCVEWNWNIYQTGYSHLESAAAAVRNRLWQQEPYNVAGCEIAYAKSSPIVVVWKIFWPYFLSSSKRDISVLNAKLFPYLEEKRSPFGEKENIFLRFKNLWKRTPLFSLKFLFAYKTSFSVFLMKFRFWVQYQKKLLHFSNNLRKNFFLPIFLRFQSCLALSGRSRPVNPTDISKLC